MSLLKQVKNKLKKSYGNDFFNLLCSHYKLHQVGPLHTTIMSLFKRKGIFHIFCNVDLLDTGVILEEN